ncbi:hypothetical protein Tco_1273532 [Tanacetum coccineum]
MFESGTYKSLLGHIALYEALKASMTRAQRDEFLAEKDKSRKQRCDDQDLPPPLPDSDLSKRRRHDTSASGSSQPLAPQSSALKKSDTRDAPSSSSKQQSGPHDEQTVEDMPIPDSANISDSEDTGSAHLPHVIPTSHVPDAENNWANALATTYQAPTENSLLEKTEDMRTFMNWYCQKMGKTKLTQADLEGQAYEVTNPEGDQVRIDINRPLSLSGPPGHVTVQTQFFFNHDLDYLQYSSKGSGQALSISKMKVARYHDFGLKLLVPEHMWINDCCQNKAYSRYEYDYLKEITLRRADHQEYTIAEKDFKNLYPSDFEDLNLLLLQGHLNHLPGSDIHMLSTALNLTKPGWDATDFEFKHDYTIIDSPPLDYKVKEYKVNRLNPGMNTRFWTDKDVERSKDSYMPLNEDSRPEGSSRIWNALLVDGFAILTTDFFRERNAHFIPFIRIIIRVLRIILVVLPEHPSDTYVFTMKMEILLEPTSSKLMVGQSLQDLEVQVKIEMEIPCSSGVYFITACSYSTDTSNNLMKAQVYVSKLPQL